MGGTKRVAIVARNNGATWLTWRKIYLGIDEQTLEVRAVEVIGSNIGDPPMLRELLNLIPGDQQIVSVTAGGAYDTHKCLEVSGPGTVT